MVSNVDYSLGVAGRLFNALRLCGSAALPPKADMVRQRSISPIAFATFLGA
jgi:hypothetical protein